MDASKFDSVIDGKNVGLYHIHTQNLSCFITNYGARLVSLSTFDKDYRKVDVVLGFTSLQEYMDADEQYHGATVGRYANRIAHGAFTLNGAQYQLAKNNGGNSLHGGMDAFHNQVWDCIAHKEDEVVFQLTSPHMEEGFPGELTTRVVYKLQGSDLKIAYEATSTRDTIINLTHHSYFNLNGEGSGDVLKHRLMINADYYTPVDTNVIPTGELKMVADTPFDFTSMKEIGQHIEEDDMQLVIGAGYDHNFVVNHYDEGILNLIAKIKGDQTHILMEVWSTEPGVQFYSANHLNGTDKGKSDQKYASRNAFCLETQHFPDSPNQSHFPSTILKAGDVFSSTTEYRFSID